MKTKLKQQALSEYLLNNSMARQAIINGNFDVWQRETSSTTVTAMTADRWVGNASTNSGTLPTLTYSRQSLTLGDIPNSFYYFNINANGAGSSLGNSAFDYRAQRIEHGNRFLCGNGKKVTLSFWAKSDVAGKRIATNFRQNYGTGGSPTAEESIDGTIITLSSTWTKYTITVETNTLVGKTFGTANDDYFQVSFYFMWGTTIATARFGGGTAEDYGGSGNTSIAQVQLCAGEVALPFMPKPYSQELMDCMRYYETGRTRFFATGVYIGGSSWFRVNKRVASYTATFFDALGNANRVSTASGGGSNNLPITGGNIFAVKNTYGFESDALVGTSAENWAVFSWKVDAEL